MDLSVDRSLAIGGVIVTTVLLVLDKAGKLKGPALLVLLGLALCMMIPILFSIPWVSETSGLAQLARRGLMVIIVGMLWAMLSVWITSGDTEREFTSNNSGSSSQQNTERLRSYLTIGLVIDEVSIEFIQFHFLLKNDGHSEIKISHLAYKSQSETATELNIGPIRTIIPSGRLVSNGRISRSDAPGPLSATATYNMYGNEQPVTVTFGFQVRVIDLSPRTDLEPSSREELVGASLVPMQIILDGLKQATGSLTSWFPEKRSDW